MKKLFLSSSFKDVAKLFPGFASNDLIGKTVTFIPTAALHEKINFYVASGRKALEKMGLKVDDLEVSTAAQSDILTKLQSNDFIYVSGGNTFFLLQELRRVGADKIITEQIESGKLYIGESAGSIILSPNTEYIKDMDNDRAAPDLNSFDALNIVDFYPLPHKNCFPFQKTVDKICAKYSDTLPLIPFTNAQAILINGNEISVLANNDIK